MEVLMQLGTSGTRYNLVQFKRRNYILFKCGVQRCSVSVEPRTLCED